MINMDADMATRFIASLSKSLQAVIHGCLDFEQDIELGGYVFLKVDNAQRIDYVLNEKMQKSDLNSMTFHSNSFHALPQSTSEHPQPSKDKSNISTNSTDFQEKSISGGRSLSRSDTESSMFSMTQSAVGSKISNPTSSTNSRNSNSFMQPKSDFQKFPSSSNRNAAANASDDFNSNNRSQSLTDFQTAFRSQPTSHSNQSQQSSSANSWSLSHNGSSSRVSSGQPLPQQSQQQNRSSLLPDASDMEVVHIKTEDEDDVFNIPLQCQQGGSESDGLAVQGKAPWLAAMRMQQPFYFPYPRLARSQSFDRRLSMATSSSRFPFFSGESSSENSTLSCKICGKSYRSRQGLLFHERAKHQNVFNVYCPVCGKGFQQTTHMYGHMATHTNVKNFQCQACGAKYAHKTSLQQHLRSGSCRASQMSSPAGLDLSTSQLLRDFSPNSVSETQSRPSPSYSHSQSPLETADHAQERMEGDCVANQTRLPSFSQMNQPDTGSDMGDKMDGFDDCADLNMSKDNAQDSLNMAGGNRVMDQAMTGYGNEPRDSSLLGERNSRGMFFSGGAESEGMSMAREDARGLNLSSRDDVRGQMREMASDSPSPRALGIDMTKNTQDYDNAGSAESGCDDDFSGHDALYEHDSDIPGTVPLSLSADDDD